MGYAYATFCESRPVLHYWNTTTASATDDNAGNNTAFTSAGSNNFAFLWHVTVVDCYAFLHICFILSMAYALVLL